MVTTEFTEYAKEVKEGNINPLEAYITLKAALVDLEKALKEVQDLAIDEACKYGQKSFEAFGAKVEVRNGASRWDYSGVQVWKHLKEQIGNVEKLAQMGGQVYVETGEPIEQANKILGRETIAISFK
jgi:hypothetical protein